MNLNINNKTNFNGYLRTTEGEKINTDEVVAIKDFGKQFDVVTMDKNNLRTHTYFDNSDYLKVLTAYTAACQNKNIVIDLPNNV